jgi:hypothetical protein
MRKSACLTRACLLRVSQVRMMDKLALEKEKFEALLEKFQLDVKRAKVHSDYDNFEAVTEEVSNSTHGIKRIASSPSGRWHDHDSLQL